MPSPIAAGSWVFTNADSPAVIIGTLRKRVADSLWFEFDLGDVPEIVAQETIVSSVCSVSPSGLTLGSPTLGTYKVGLNISGGTSTVTYNVTCTVTTSAGAIISRTGEMVVT